MKAKGKNMKSMVKHDMGKSGSMDKLSKEKKGAAKTMAKKSSLTKSKGKMGY